MHQKLMQVIGSLHKSHLNTEVKLVIKTLTRKMLFAVEAP